MTDSKYFTTTKKGQCRIVGSNVKTLFTLKNFCEKLHAVVTGDHKNEMILKRDHVVFSTIFISIILCKY